MEAAKACGPAYLIVFLPLLCNRLLKIRCFWNVAAPSLRDPAGHENLDGEHIFGSRVKLIHHWDSRTRFSRCSASTDSAFMPERITSQSRIASNTFGIV
jgi:hypothetical protein